MNKNKIVCFVIMLLLFVTGCNFNESLEIAELELGESIKLNIDIENPKWESSDNDIAVVSDNGVVKAVGYGEAIITASNNEESSSIKVSVENNSVKEAKLQVTGKQTVKVGENIQLYPEMINVEENIKYEYKTNDDAVVIVSDTGLVTGVSEGIATITVSALYSQTITKDVMIYVIGETEKNIINITQNIEYILSGDVNLDTLSNKIENIVTEYKDSIMGVSNYQYVRSVYGQTLEIAGTGTGFIYDKQKQEDGSNLYYVLTNYHVIEDNEKVTLYFGYSDLEVNATVISESEAYDLAIVTFVSDIDYKILEFAENDDVHAGDFAIAIGNPEGYDYFGSVSFGIVSYNNRVMKTEQSTFVQHDVAINPGNSGGPLLNMDGKVIGVNTLKIITDDVDNLGFSIDVNTIKDFLKI